LDLHGRRCAESGFLSRVDVEGRVIDCLGVPAREVLYSRPLEDIGNSSPEDRLKHYRRMEVLFQEAIINSGDGETRVHLSYPIPKASSQSENFVYATDTPSGNSLFFKRGDADSLEATGAISIMRTYSSTGQMKRPFYNSEDPFCENRKPDSLNFALDLFYDKLLKVTDKMHTKTSKSISKRRTDFLIDFLKELKLEWKGSNFFP
jgi:hypothetical protein|tara:strand:- start:29732 stop:30346 length:615 start_codon:yes stop_codon:yes gene_type:complete